MSARLGIALRPMLRLLFGHQVVNGLSVAAGFLACLLLVYAVGGTAHALAASVGVLMISVTDTVAPRTGKLQQLAPALLLGAPLSLLTQLAHHMPWALCSVVVIGSFLATLGLSWGKRGGPIAFALIFSMVLAMAMPVPTDALDALVRTAWFALGAGLYVLWGLLSTRLLNARYRTQLFADALAGMAEVLHTQALRFALDANHAALQARMMGQQAALADRLQSARDLVLEAPATPHEQAQAAMLLSLLEARDHLLASELDLDLLRAHPTSAGWLPGVQALLTELATTLDDAAWAFLRGRRPVTHPGRRPRLTAMMPAGQDSTALMQRHLLNRLGHMVDELERLGTMATESAPGAPGASMGDPDRWQLFLSPTRWTLQPLLRQLSWRAPVMRYALRAAMAIGVGLVLAEHLPWAAHKHWILLTIVVVMRMNLSQTLERRNARLLGTVIGCLLATLLLAAHPDKAVLLVLIALSAATAHAFVTVRYLVAAVAATLLGLLQIHLLGAESRFDVVERLADTVIGTVLAWAFSYVLPAWERQQLPALVLRLRKACANLAAQVLAPPKPASSADAKDDASGLAWRLARREAYDSLSLLTLAAQRTASEPSAVRPPLQTLETLQLRSYRFLAHLTSIKTMLTVRRNAIDLAVAEPAVNEAAADMAKTLSTDAPAMPEAPVTSADLAFETADSVDPPDPPAAPDLTAWLLRRLRLARVEARALAGDAGALMRRS